MNVQFDPTKVKPLVLKGGMNTGAEVIREQVRQNIRRHLPQVQPYAPNGQTAILVCGGPSLAETERELVEAYWAGGKIVAVNGSYQWCIERNLKPSAMVMLDARAWNKRFVERDVPGCKYLLASQCHPETFDMCRARETWIWHNAATGDEEVALLKQYYFGRTYPVTGGSTVGLNAIMVLTMLGWSRLDVFGLDSCWLGGAHHAYEQPENNDKKMRVWVRPHGRDDQAQAFECAPWHAKQAEDFLKLVRVCGNNFNLNVRGPGLLASILRTSAEIRIEEIDNGPERGTVECSETDKGPVGAQARL